MEAAVEVVNLSKHFKLYKEKYTSLKERVLHGMKAPYDEFWALADINMQISPGETAGLLGHNGSGKSTLLKLIAGILQPTSGRVVLRGSVAALLELGAGFHGELSGRDNVYLNASLLGLGRKQVDRLFDDIVAFAELEQFIDNQVKYYSSGMQARLGFAVAVNVDPDILLVDEVLAVGDENFQRKCLDRIAQFQKDGKTIIFVTHAPDMVRQICDKAFVLDHGRVVAAGAPGEAIRTFREYLMSTGAHAPAEVLDQSLLAEADSGVGSFGSGDVRITSVAIEGGGESAHLRPGEPMSVRVAFEAKDLVTDAVFGISIHNGEGDLIFHSSTNHQDLEVGLLRGSGEALFEFESVPLLDGAFAITLEVRGTDTGTVYAWREQVDHFEVVNPGRDTGLVAFPLRIKVRGS